MLVDFDVILTGNITVLLLQRLRGEMEREIETGLCVLTVEKLVYWNVASGVSMMLQLNMTHTV